MTIQGSSPQVYVNPSGAVFELITLGHAKNVVGIGEPTAQFTWFAGYAWQAVICACCAYHLGWVYVATHQGSPARFFGLIRSRLAETPR